MIFLFVKLYDIGFKRTRKNNVVVLQSVLFMDKAAVSVILGVLISFYLTQSAFAIEHIVNNHYVSLTKEVISDEVIRYTADLHDFSLSQPLDMYVRGLEEQLNTIISQIKDINVKLDMLVEQQKQSDISSRSWEIKGLIIGLVLLVIGAVGMQSKIKIKELLKKFNFRLFGISIFFNNKFINLFMDNIPQIVIGISSMVLGTAISNIQI